MLKMTWTLDSEGRLSATWNIVEAPKFAERQVALLPFRGGRRGVGSPRWLSHIADVRAQATVRPRKIR